MPEKTHRVDFFRLLGLVLLIVAVALYIRSHRAKKEQQLSVWTTNLIRAIAADASEAHAHALERSPSAKTIAVTHTIEGLDLPPFLYPCPEDITTNLLASLSLTEPVKLPSEIIEGDLFMLRLLDTSNRVTVLRAIRPYDRPDDAYIGLFLTNPETGEETLSPPTVAPGAGPLLGQCLKAIVEGGQKAMSDPAFLNNFSNAVRRVIEQRETKESQPAGDNAP